MAQLKDRGHPAAPPAMATDGKGDYREALVDTWGQVPEYSGVGRPPSIKRPQPEWQYLQVVKTRSGSRLIGVTIKVIYGARDCAGRCRRAYGLYGANQSDVAPDERASGAENPVLFQATGGTPGI